MKNNTRRAKVWLVRLSVLLLISSTLGVFFLGGLAEAAAPTPKNIVFTPESEVISHQNKNTLKMSKHEKTYTQINEDAGTGNKIQKIVFYKGNTAVKTINVNAQSFSQRVELDGEKTKAVSADNGAKGSWMAWNRTQSNTWVAGDGNQTVLSSFNPGTEEHSSFSAAPGKKVEMTVQYSRTQNFYNETLGGSLPIPLEAIDNRVGTIIAENPSTPPTSENDPRAMVNKGVFVQTGSLGIKGKAHESTKLEEIIIGLRPGDPPTPNGGYRDLNYATIKFTQDHDKDGYKYYLRQGNADMELYDETRPKSQAMMYYYAAYSFTITSYTYIYPNTYRVFTEAGPQGESMGFCNVREGRTIEGDAEGMLHNASAVIKADQRDREVFDVLQGIPTSESLYGNVLAKNYLNKYKFQEQKVTCIYEVTVTQPYILKWDPGKPNPADPPIPTTIPDPQEANDSKQYEIHTERYFTYWTVEELGIYKIDSAELRNYAFEGESIIIHPKGYTPPELTVEKNGGFTAPDVPPPFTAPDPITVPGGTSRPSPTNDIGVAEALVDEKIGQVKGKNDKVVFNGQTIMDDREAERQTQPPSRIPNGTMIDRDVLYSSDHQIPSTKTNRYSAPSLGTITYVELDDNHNADPGDTYPIGSINPVTVHTPVVNYSSATDDQAHNQKTVPNGSRAAFILDRPFTVRIPTSGQHANYVGYGHRDYAKYFRAKQVRFPFDVYTADRSIFYEKNTWIDIPVSQLDTTFFLPVWVDEGDYSVEFRNIAENAPDVQPAERDANLDLINHVASDTVNVEVIGRLYDFHITDIVDYSWEKVFRVKEGRPLHTGDTYWTGLNGIDGAARGNTPPFTLPILPGSHPLEGMKNLAVKTGYHVKFDLKTKGNMFGEQDGIRITPSFTFVSRDGQSKMPVDLYYHDDHRTFIKVGSPEDTEPRYVILNDRLRNVPEEELRDTARYKYNHYYGFSQVGNVSREMFINDYIYRFTKMKTPVGGYDRLLLPEQIRTLIGPKSSLPASVDYERANAAEQKWYGEYSLPGDPYVVAKGTDLAEYGRTHRGLTKRDPIFLRDGYIILNFNIESIRNGNLDRPHLQYIHAPLMNQWNLEGFRRSVQDSWGNTFSLQDGDIVFFHADKSYKDDFQVQVPH
ncbi:DUF5704 domain-containing protein [Saccharibacillus kuerlensis]|uniref:DUF5704 domain-containing protein n=1 Tax=Saccharibacillus kuerlensis TaxID=459527 RepID=A0ABQ2L8U2_9BACL|nr:DUF5704 domain-containing protein [Saccharibacillus kuerlensis]GGO06728.1 hypothetical protein GCM10010969_34600 [Saccharibacillus kuerlensis]